MKDIDLLKLNLNNNKGIHIHGNISFPHKRIASIY